MNAERQIVQRTVLEVERSVIIALGGDKFQLCLSQDYLELRYYSPLNACPEHDLQRQWHQLLGTFRGIWFDEKNEKRLQRYREKGISYFTKQNSRKHSV